METGIYSGENKKSRPFGRPLVVRIGNRKINFGVLYLYLWLIAHVCFEYVTKRFSLEPGVFHG